jgi:ABC-type glycerol-3-phosphate transport system permease component
MIRLFYELVVLRIGNTYLGLILHNVSTNVPFALFMLSGFLAGLPRELAEAAKLDGCSNFELVRRIVVPLGRPLCLEGSYPRRTLSCKRETE